MKVHFEKPEGGNFRLSISHDEKNFIDYISNFPGDFIYDLMPMLTRIWTGDPNV